MTGACCAPMRSCGPSTTWASTVTSWRSVSALPCHPMAAPGTANVLKPLRQRNDDAVHTLTGLGVGAVCDDRHPSVLLDVLEHCQLSHPLRCGCPRNRCHAWSGLC